MIENVNKKVRHESTIADSSKNLKCEVNASQDIHDELAKLREAVASREAESICVAYLALREKAVASDMKLSEVFGLADEALSQSTALVILSAFSHRHCPMCEDGTARCRECKGTGLAGEERKCPACDGVGATSCDFCKGTGWAAWGMIPAEVPRNTLKRRQLANVKEDMIKLTKTLGKLDAEKKGKLPAELRRNLTRWAMRLRARLRSLAKEEIVGRDEKKRLLADASKLDRRLSMLRGS
jgi:hypothetical protein